MKTEQLIVRYLYNNRKVTIQDIGTFTVSPEINLPTENDKDTALPPDAIQFTCDFKALPDEGLIAYIMEQTRKIRPLAASDLESYSMLNTQFLNIGKPLVLEGVGTLQKAQTGEYAYTQAGTSHLTFEEAPKLVTEKQKEQISFATPPRETSAGGGKAAVWIIVLLLIGAAAVAVYYFMQHREKSANTESAVVADDTLTSDTATLNSLKDTLAAAVPAVKDSNSFYIVVNEYNTLAAAEKRIAFLKTGGNDVTLSIKDSSSFRVRMPFMLPLADTLHVKDSLSKFFGTKAKVELP